MFFYALLAALFLALPASASSERQYVKWLSQARTSNEVARIKNAFEELKIARAACKLQVRSGRAPLACYDSLAAEIQWGMHPSKAARRELRARLDALCSDAAARLEVPRREPNQAHVSRKCLKEMAGAREIQKYRRLDRPEWSGS